MHNLARRRIEERAAEILDIWEARKDISLEELRARLAEIGLTVSVAGLHRAKKTGHAIEQDRPTS